jgi:hypothetical protein
MVDKNTSERYSHSKAQPSLERGSAEDPSLKEACGPSGGECPVVSLKSQTKKTLISLAALASLASGTQATPKGSPQMQ